MHGASTFIRTTIELTSKQRARLLEIAATRGLKGFSSLVQEAVDLYLKEQAGRGERVRAALSAFGTFGDEAAEGLREAMHRSRESWR